MIEKLSQEELKQLISELTENGLLKMTGSKANILMEEAEKLGYKGLFVQSDMSANLYNIADQVTDNFVTKITSSGKTRTCKTNTVPKEKEQKYREVISALLLALKPYTGISGFKEIRQ